MTGHEQEAIVNKFMEALNRAVSVYKVDKEAICIATPFLDWQGAPTKIYVTEDGKVTDGGSTVNLLRSLRNIDQLDEWPFLLSFLNNYCIKYDGRSMMLRDDASDDCLLLYAQGLSRLPSYFEPKPIYSTEDRFPYRAKAIATELIDQKNSCLPLEERNKLISSIVTSRHITLENGYSITSDLSPRKMNRLVTIISHANDSPSQRKAHVQSKLLDPIIWKRESKNGEVFAVLEDIEVYSQPSQKLLENEADEIIELKDNYGRERYVEALLA